MRSECTAIHSKGNESQPEPEREPEPGA